jgi:hypothetical protein
MVIKMNYSLMFYFVDRFLPAYASEMGKKVVSVKRYGKVHICLQKAVSAQYYNSYHIFFILFVMSSVGIVCLRTKATELV